MVRKEIMLYIPQQIPQDFVYNSTDSPTTSPDFEFEPINYEVILRRFVKYLCNSSLSKNLSILVQKSLNSNLKGFKSFLGLI